MRREGQEAEGQEERTGTHSHKHTNMHNQSLALTFGDGRKNWRSRRSARMSCTRALMVVSHAEEGGSGQCSMMWSFGLSCVEVWERQGEQEKRREWDGGEGGKGWRKVAQGG
jgi:hypothetical protein